MHNYCVFPSTTLRCVRSVFPVKIGKKRVVLLRFSAVWTYVGNCNVLSY